MAKKDTSSTVRDMLSTGRDLRPLRSEAPARRPVPSTDLQRVAPEPTEPTELTEPVVESAVPVAVAVPAAQSSGRGRGGGRPAKAAANGDAPRTLRLAQHVANDLRAAWLDEKRNGADVLLSLQDFAGQVLADGLRARGHDTGQP